ncbi:hypothetical protein [Lacrimispora algidixylanolytica]|uniref:Uncharacterized protein n=1 Tax=Lacrimispora algidixylanolytica TaxID=94868 RepID=A0A419TC11_9FIRM|nr:hypothetical protein [Lacrimispora algidixylanolytica]RKD34985.1 hypothetical protein BET01_01115 [Lacrimispora algidixylanolytica]
MKVKSKNILLCLTVLSIGTIMMPLDAFAQSQKTESSMVTQKQTPEKHYLDAQIIEWRYKTVNGKMYRRQYNYSRKKWVGDWELCD